METKKQYIERDISWLSFNYRVLQEAKDNRNPLFERVKFLAIYSSNLEEFFRVRVASLHNLLRVGKKTKKTLSFDPKESLKLILKIVNKQQEEFSQIFENQLIPELRHHNIFMLRRLDLNREQSDFVEDYFHNNLLPFVQPVLLVKDKIRPFLNNGATYLAVRLQPKHKIIAPEEYGMLKVPSDHLPRFINLPSSEEGRHDVIMLDDIVRHSVSWLFPGYHIVDAYSVKLTRDAELYIEDEFTGDLVDKIKKSLTKRNVGPASRFIYDRTIPEKLLVFLKEMFDLDKRDLLPEGRYHNNSDFFKFPDFGLTSLKNAPLPPLPYPILEKKGDVFESIDDKDHLLYYPYQSYASVIRFFEQASKDPLVTHIKVVQYRVAKNSKVVNSLIEAAKNGKKVMVFVEVKARFDEELNLYWGEALHQAGVEVHYSMPGLKVHTKLALVQRKEVSADKNNEGSTLYTYLSTGNFHEDTAKIYSDFGLFTTDPRITSEVERVFNYLETATRPKKEFKHLLVGQFNLRSRFLEMIDKEIAHAKQGKPSGIFLKMNSLQDPTMVDKLYEASHAGVSIKLIIRGICTLVPNEKGISENIKAISIVDRFLEHARVFMFYNNGNETIYLSSADWMTRNLSYRVETAFPIYDEKHKKRIRALMDLQWNDNVKARILDKNQTNTYQKNDEQHGIRSQVDTYQFMKKHPEG